MASREDSGGVRRFEDPVLQEVATRTRLLPLPVRYVSEPGDPLGYYEVPYLVYRSQEFAAFRGRFDVVDPEVPYVRHRRSLQVIMVQPRKLAEQIENAGPWKDLSPDYVPSLPRPARGTGEPLGTAPGKPEDIAALLHLEDGVAVGDGFVRDRLMQIGIRKPEWEACDPDLRRMLRSVLRDEIVVEQALVAAVIPPAELPDDSLGRWAREFLVRLGRSLRAEYSQDQTRSFARLLGRLRAKHVAKELVYELVPAMKKIKRRGSEQGSRGFGSLRWRQQAAAALNERIRSRFPGILDLFDEALVGRLRIARADTVAKEVILEYLSHFLAEDDFRRGQVRMRSRRTSRAAPGRPRSS